MQAASLGSERGGGHDWEWRDSRIAQLDSVKWGGRRKG
jgi:hypothetical protein